MNNVSKQFVKKIQEMSRAALPARIEQKARNCFVDYLSVVVGGSKSYVDANQKFIAENGCCGECHVVGIPRTVDIRTAVMMNAFNAHVLELDDSHRVAMTHLGAPIFSALLGVAEQYDCTMEMMLKAAVIGYQAAISLANTIQPSHKRRGFHVSGTCCTVGCAMAIAAMLGQSEEEMANTLSAAATTAAGLLAVISGKSEQKPYNIANAALAGMNAALYGRLFHGAVDILGDSRGFLRAMSDCYDAKKLFEDGYAIESIYQKLYAACRHCHAPMEAMLMIKTDHDFDADEIDSIEVRTYDLAIEGHDHTRITGISSAKQSIPYGVAVACMYQNCGLDAFTERRLKDARLQELINKVKVVEDAELSAMVPEKRAAVVTVVLNTGKKYVSRVDYPKGEPENPITEVEMADKFYMLAKSAGKSKETSEKLFAFAKEAANASVKEIFRYL